MQTRKNMPLRLLCWLILID